MDQVMTRSSSTEDLCSIDTIDADNTLSLPIHQIDPGDVHNQNKELQKQVEELTKQLNESKSSEKRANDEYEKYYQIYNRTNERFVTFERKQLDQMHRILNKLTINQHRTFAVNQDNYLRPRRAFTNPSTSILLPSLSNQDQEDINSTKSDLNKTENEWTALLTQISDIMEFSEKFTDKYSQQTDENNKLRLLNHQKQDENIKLLFDISLIKAEYEQEQQKRHHVEHQFDEVNKSIEQDRSKRLQKLRNYATLADDEGDILLSSLMKKAEKNDTDFREIKVHYENLFMEQINQTKKLIKERELLQLHIQRLEQENTLLASRTNNDETIKLLTYSSQTPTSYDEACNLITQLREQIIQQIKIQDTLKNDIQQLQHCHETDIQERKEMEELFNRDLTAAKDEILALQSLRDEYEHILNIKKDLEKQLEDRTNELLAIKTGTTSLTNEFKEKLERINSEKEKLNEDNAGLRIQVHKLKMDYENSESVQHDFVKLSQSLQVQLEEFRNSQYELRWQPEEDFPDCQRCHTPFSVTWRKHHCRHCGKVLCKDCTNKTVYSGPNNRPSRVCDVCYTLLEKHAQPYFLTAMPKY
ncbi:unnamed protein product [Adineta steineri]|uniref:FYVE-type domain-containing protein n=2 Tax=Adineta steineri TaxID=433720 RepID=A0A818TU87_9BILA|nr:unnamed protein product [Adineta steineri]CAF3689661.1 unnamed protein product [Adineta steineri]